MTIMVTLPPQKLDTVVIWKYNDETHYRITIYYNITSTYEEDLSGRVGMSHAGAVMLYAETKYNFKFADGEDGSYPPLSDAVGRSWVFN